MDTPPEAGRLNRPFQAGIVCPGSEQVDPNATSVVATVR
jgi:hypothetical protein